MSDIESSHQFITHRSSLTTFQGDVAQRNQSIALRTRRLQVRVLPSLPNQFLTNDLSAGGRSQSNVAILFRGRLTGRTSGSEPGNMGSTPIPEAKILNCGRAYPLSGRSTDGYMGLFWKQVFAGSNPAARTKFSFACSPIGRGAGLRNRRLRVRISPRVPTVRTVSR